VQKLQEKVAIVTGATRGIGRAIAGALAGQGARVVLAARSAEDVNAATEELVQRGQVALGVPTDVTREDQVRRLVAAADDRFGRIDILVNNAGIGVFKPVADLEVADLDAMWSVNMRGVFVATKAVLPYMIRAAAGAIVNINSLAGKNSFVGGAGYAATKWALRGFAGCLMLEVREYNIRVVSVFPGSVDTGFSRTGKRGDTITQPEDVADAVVFAVTAPARSMFSEIDVRPTRPK
jgi:NADP-dependent 3-hydroxy acid dehydrogenase YdfG